MFGHMFKRRVVCLVTRTAECFGETLNDRCCQMVPPDKKSVKLGTLVEYPSIILGKIVNRPPVILSFSLSSNPNFFFAFC
mgnify:CR=1 FL=1